MCYFDCRIGRHQDAVKSSSSPPASATAMGPWAPASSLSQFMSRPHFEPSRRPRCPAQLLFCCETVPCRRSRSLCAALGQRISRRRLPHASKSVDRERV